MTARRAVASGLRHPLTWLILFVIIFFYKEIFLGRVFSPSDLLYILPPWQSQEPAGWHFPANATRSDEAFIFFPRRLTLGRDVAQFGFSLWDEHVFAGVPNSFSINFAGAILYPPMWAFVFLDPRTANTVLHLPIPFLAALAMYLLLGRITSSRPIRVLGSLAWAFNGYMVAWLSAFFLPLTMAALPALLYLAIRFLDEDRRLAGIGYAVLLGWTFYLGYQPANLIVLVFVGLFATVWLALRRGLKKMAGLAGLTVLGIGLGALPIVTGVVQLGQFVSHQYRPVQLSLPLRDLQTFLLPNVYGNPIANDWRLPQGNLPEYVAYAGSLTLIIGLAGLVLLLRGRAWRNPLLLSSAAIGLLSFLLAYAIWPANHLSRVPVLQSMSLPRWHIGVVFTGVVLGAWALEQSRQEVRARRVLLGCGLAVLLVFAGLFLVHVPRLQQLDPFIRGDFALRALFLAAGLMALLLLQRSHHLAVIALPVVLAADLFSFGVNINPAVASAEFYPQTPALRFLADHAASYRVLVARPQPLLWPGDVLTVYGLDSVTGYDHFRDARYLALLGGNVSSAERNYWSSSGYLTMGQTVDLADPVFSELGVRYAWYPDLRSRSSDPSRGLWRAVYSAWDGLVLENPSALPPQFLLPRPGAKPIAINHPPQAPDHDELLVSGPGILVWSKPSSSDWRISVNGRVKPSLNYHEYFLATSLARGVNRVRLEYRPFAYTAGGLLSGASLLLTVLLFVLAAPRRAYRWPEVASCPICDSRMLRRSLVTSRLAVLRCLRCGHRLARHQPTEAGMVDYHVQYEQGSFVDALAETRRRQALRILELISKERPHSDGVLDFGAGRGWFLDACRSAGFQRLAGADSSELAIRSLRERGYATVLLGTEETIPIPTGLPFPPTVLALLDVIEHFPPESLRANLTRLIESLEPTLELVVIKVPVADGILYRLAVLLSRLGLHAPIEQLYQVGTDPPHYSYFSRRSLLHLLATLRLQVRAVVGDADFDAATMRGRVRALRRLPGPAVSSGSRAAVLIGRWLSAEDAIIVLARPQSGGH